MSKKTGSAQDGAKLAARLSCLAPELRDKEFRHGYMSKLIRAFLGAQIRALRGKESQTDFGKRIGKPQSVVSRLEDEGYGKVNVSTLLDIAKKLDVGLFVRFVDFPTFIEYSNDFSDDALTPKSYSPDAIDELISEARSRCELHYGLIPAQNEVSGFTYIRSLSRNEDMASEFNRRRTGTLADALQSSQAA